MDIGAYGTIEEQTDDTSDYIVILDKNYSFAELSMLQDKLNKNSNILALMINIVDTSSWTDSKIPIN